jgi:hypothetical protein
MLSSLILAFLVLALVIPAPISPGGDARQTQ